MSGLGRFDHHPDPAIDFCVEVDAIEGLAYDAKVGLTAIDSVQQRIDRAMNFCVGGDLNAIEAKAVLRRCESELAQ